MGVIEREALVKWLKDAGWYLCTLDGAKVERKVLGKIIDHVEAMPTVDAVEVVRCRYCIMHNNCTTEDAFKLCGIEDPFCCAGKRKEPVKPPEETEDSFLMQRFLKVE